VAKRQSWLRPSFRPLTYIPCRDRISHRPGEYSSPEAIGKGVHVLAQTLARVAE
jgi:ureidoglycolate amidohydrolase